MLIVPKRHCEDYFGLTIEEKLSIDKLVLRCQQRFYFP
jgi:diadenosine tetraphosphate (Ap4A) HIT family hydrolase